MSETPSREDYIDVLSRLSEFRWPFGRRRNFCVAGPDSRDGGAVRITTDRAGAWVTCSIYVPNDLAKPRGER